MLLNSAQQKVPAAVNKVCDSVPFSSNVPVKSSVESEANTFGTVGLVQDEQKTPKVSIDIPVTVEEVSDTPKAEPATATKHPEENKLSSEIPKKKPKPSTSDERKTQKKAKKHKEKSTEKSDEISCKPKKVSRHPKATSDGLKKQEKELIEASECCKKDTPIRNDPEERMSAKCDVCITLEIEQPATMSAEFTKPIYATKSKCLLLSDVVRIRKDETEAAKRRNTTSPSRSNRVMQQLPSFSSGSVSKLSEINKKGSSVAAILSMFTEKAERERRCLDRRPSRPVRTFRDVEKPSSRKASLASNHENETSCVKLYRAPEEEKERVKNLIELHRRGSADCKQVGTQEIVAVKQEENLASTKKREDASKSSSRAVNVDEQDCVGAGEKSTARGKMELDTVKGTKQPKRSVNKSIVPGLPLPELSTLRRADQLAAKHKKRTTAMIKTESNLQNKTETAGKYTAEQTIIEDAMEGTERTAKNALQLKMPHLEHFDGHEAGSQLAGRMESVEKRQGSERNGEASGALSAAKDAASCEKREDSIETRQLGKLDELSRDSVLNFTNLNSGQINRPESAKSDNNIAETDVVDTKTKLSKAVSEKKYMTKKKVLESDPNVKSISVKSIIPENAKKSAKLRNISRDSEKKTRGHVDKATALTNIDSPCRLIQLELVEEARNENLERSSALQPLSANLGSTNKYTEDDRNPKVTQGVTLKKPPKAPGASERKTFTKEVKVKKLQDGYGSSGDVMNPVLQGIKKTHGSTENKVISSMNRGQPHAIQDVAKKSQIHIRDESSQETPPCDGVKRNFSPRNPLMKIKSDINLAERTRKAQSNQSDRVRLRRKAIDDEAALSTRTDEGRRSITVASLKQNENFNFGWLKLQLEARVNKEKEQQMGWRPRRELEISSVQTGNAKKALNIWKTMEQNSITRT